MKQEFREMPPAGVFISPFVDEGFKIIFGQEKNKDVLIEFLNILFEGEEHIVDLQYLDKEMPRELVGKRTIIYDILCRTDKNEYILVEMQNKRQAFFEKRAAYYMASAIVNQGATGAAWGYDLKRVYGVFFLNFNLPGHKPRLRVDLEKRDRHTGEPFEDYQRMTYIMFPEKNKDFEECKDDFERIIFVLKNMEHLMTLPGKKYLPIIEKLEAIARRARLSPEQRRTYDKALDAYMVEENAMLTAVEEGREEGRKEGLEEGRSQEQQSIIRNMHDNGMDAETIARCTNIALDKVLAALD